MIVTVATPFEAPLLSALHPDWSADEFVSLLTNPSHLALLLLDGEDPAGFCIAALTPDEAELLQITTDPRRRRQGLGRRLMGALSDAAELRGCHRLLLEVAEDNEPARALYAAAGLREIGRRRGYYRDGTDALMLAADLPLSFRADTV